MARQRNYHAEYEARKQRAIERGTTYGRERYRQDVQRAHEQGYRNVRERAREVRQSRLRQDRLADVFDYLPQLEEETYDGIPDRDQIDRDIANVMHSMMAPDWQIRYVLDQDNRWAAFRAWYGKATAA